MELTVMAAGATEAILMETAERFERQSGCTLRLSFAPVGALRLRICGGEPADLAIVTPAISGELRAAGLLRPEPSVPLGQVGGGIAVLRGAPLPAVATSEELKQALLAAEEIYHADPAIATAGVHFLQAAERLGIGDEVRRKARTAGSGKATMQRMAASTARAIGLTQISEILSVPEVALVAPYPAALQRMTVYEGVLPLGALQVGAARTFLNHLTGTAVQARFRRSGFEPASGD